VEVWTANPEDLPPREGDEVDRYKYQGLSVSRFRHNYAMASGAANAVEAEYDNPLVRKQFATFIAAARPDLVHFVHLGRLSASPISACKDAGIPTVFTSTDFWFICPMYQLRLPNGVLCQGPDANGQNCVRHIAGRGNPKGIRLVLSRCPSWIVGIGAWATRRSWWPEKRYSRLVKALVGRPGRILQLLNQVDRVVVPSLLMETFMVGHGINPARIRRIPYGVTLQPAMAHTRRTSGGRLCLGFIGSLASHKGAHVLLGAVAGLATDAPVEVKLFGDPDEFPEYGGKLRRMAAADERISFKGTFPNERMAEVLAGIDALVVPSTWYENTPLVVYSAQAARIPVIASDVGGLSEAIEHEKSGLLFPMGDVGALRAIIERILDDRSLLGELALGAPTPPSMSQYVDALESVYQEALRGREQTS